jgi:hypothetical protein
MNVDTSKRKRNGWRKRNERKRKKEKGKKKKKGRGWKMKLDRGNAKNL